MSPFQSKLTCPFCFSQFNLDDAKYRCINSGCPKREADTVYGAARGLSVAPIMGHVFGRKKEGWRQRVIASDKGQECDACSKQSSKRICPSCHFELSHDVGQLSEYIIAIIGGRNTGKGHYIATLIQRLESEVGRQFQFALRMLGDDTRRRFENDYYTPLFRKKSIIQPTVSAAVDSQVKLPMVFRLTFGDGKRLKAINLSFFDSAGEDMESLDTMSTEARYICYASGIVFLLDPLQIDAVRERLPEEYLPPRYPHAEPQYIIERLRELYERQFKLPATTKVKTPVAFVLSKVDSLLPLIDPSSSLFMTGEHFGHFNLTDSQSVHTEIWNYLQAWTGAGISNRVETNFENYRYFGVSSLGRMPDKMGKLETISPIRVEDPFLWILHQLGLVKGQKNR